MTILERREIPKTNYQCLLWVWRKEAGINTERDSIMGEGEGSGEGAGCGGGVEDRCEARSP